MDASREEVCSLPSKPEELSSPQRDAPNPHGSPRLQHFDLLTRQHSQVSQSNPDLFTDTTANEADDEYHTSQWAEDFKGKSLGKGNVLIRFNASRRQNRPKHNHIGSCINKLLNTKYFYVKIPSHLFRVKLSIPQVLFQFHADDVSVLIFFLMLQLPSRAPGPRRTGPGVRRKCPGTDKTGESCPAKRVCLLISVRKHHPGSVALYNAASVW